MVTIDKAYYGHTREFPTGLPGAKPILEGSSFVTANEGDIGYRFKEIRKLLREEIMAHDQWYAIDKQVSLDLDQRVIAEKNVAERPLNGLFSQWTWPVSKRPNRFRIKMNFDTQATRHDLDWGKVDVPLFQADLYIPRRELMQTRAFGIPMDTFWLSQEGRNLVEDLEDFYWNGWAAGPKNVIYGLVDVGTGTGTTDRPLAVAEATATAWDATMGIAIDLANQFSKMLQAGFDPPFTPVAITYAYGLATKPMEGPGASEYQPYSTVDWVAKSPFFNPWQYTEQMDYDKGAADDSDMGVFKFPGSFLIGTGAGVTTDPPINKDNAGTLMKVWKCCTIRQNAFYNDTAASWYKGANIWTTDTAA